MSGEATADAIDDIIHDTVANAFQEHDVGGVTVSVVANGEVALQEGIGHAYLNPDAPVSPESTLFRIGSVSKVFPFVAALRLISSGRIDPQTPVDEMLESVSVPDSDAYDDPVRLAHLATHTAGFEEVSAGQLRRSPDDLRPLPEALAANQPKQIRPPGEVPMYTNYNAGLAGQVVADIYGTDFAEAIQALVFDPLEMTTSTFDPLPPALVGGRDDAAAELDWFSEMTPASGMSTTASDMARFLEVIAGDGAIDGDQVLSPSTVEALRRQWDTPHEQLAGASFGLERRRRDGTLVIGHDGGIPDFATDLLMVPDADAGLFISVHGNDASTVQQAVSEAFLNHVAPVSEPSAPTGAPTYAHKLQGTYREVIVADAASFEKALATVKGGALSVRITDSGYLVTERWGRKHRWVEVAPLVFKRVDGADTLVFDETSDGSLTLFRATAPRTAFTAVPWYAQSALHGKLALGAGVAVLSGIVGWPLVAGWRQLHGGDSPGTAISRSRWAAGGSAVTLLAFGILGMVTLVAGWLYARPPWFKLVFVPPFLGVPFAAGAIGFLTQAWQKKDGSLLARIHATAVVTGLTVLYGLLWYWNLLQFPS